MKKIRKGDEVIVTVGKDKGKRGIVLSLGDGGRLIVEGINRAKRHVKPNPMKGQVGGIIEREMPISAANVAMYDSKSNKPSRVGVRILDDGRKVRFLKASGETVGA